MNNDSTLSRRSAIGLMAGAAGAVATASAQEPAATQVNAGPLKNRLKHSVCQWCYGKMKIDDLCRSAAAMGLQSVELLGEKDWPTVKAHGLTCAMANGPTTINKGWNRPEDHDTYVAKSEELLPKVAAAGLPNMIVFSGNRDGMDDLAGLKNCAVGLKRIMPLAEKLGVTVCMELLNSKKDHKDYMCDHTAWGVNLVQEVGSDRFKLLYDIYHMQIMEGDVISTIQANHQHIAHYHTGGVPGRHEIDETQELYYPRICQAIIETGYTGFLAQEFIPVGDPMTSLEKGVRICDV